MLNSRLESGSRSTCNVKLNQWLVSRVGWPFLIGRRQESSQNFTPYFQVLVHGAHEDTHGFEPPSLPRLWGKLQQRQVGVHEAHQTSLLPYLSNPWLPLSGKINFESSIYDHFFRRAEKFSHASNFWFRTFTIISWRGSSNVLNVRLPSAARAKLCFTQR